MKRPAVLVVTGAYYPELSGGGLQARELIRALRDRVDFAVLTTSSSVSETVRIDDIPVHRVAMNVGRVGATIRGVLRFAWLLLRLTRPVDLVHLHGFSRKNVVVTAVAKVLGKRIVLTLRTGGHDDAGVVKSRTRLGFWSFRRADTIVTVSEALREAAARAGLPADRLHCVLNGVDSTRFRPVTLAERQDLRRRLSLPEDVTIVLFVGFFSRDKGPQRLFAAWEGLVRPLRDRVMLLFVGQTRLPHFEVDPSLAPGIRDRARDVTPPPRFVERTLEIERYYQVADMFVLTSIREGCPNALLEAMATGVPVISTSLPASTDVIVLDGVNGRLVPPGDVEALGRALADILSHPAVATAYGVAARETALRGFALDRMGQAYLDIYRTLA